MKRILIWFAVAAILAIAIALYRVRSRRELDVTPDAAQEIERAKQR